MLEVNVHAWWDYLNLSDQEGPSPSDLRTLRLLSVNFLQHWCISLDILDSAKLA